MSKLTGFIGPILLSAMAAITAHCNEGCRPVQHPQEGAYVMEILGCSQKSKTKAEAVECRREVNRRYGLCNPNDYPKVSPCDE